jgi:elongation factor G
MIRERLGAKPLVMQVPVGIEASLQGVVDLVKMKAIIWKNEALGTEWDYKEIPDDLKEISKKYRKELIETAVEQDEKLMESYLNGDEIKEEDLTKCIRKGCLNFDFVPVLTGSAFKNKGVQPLLDAVIDYLPSPVDIGSIKGIKPGTEEELEMRFEDNATLNANAENGALSSNFISSSSSVPGLIPLIEPISTGLGR